MNISDLVMKRFCLFSICVCLSIKGWTQFSDFQPFSGHSHNDYYQNQPFITAFEAGMASIEADVFLWQRDLYVAHTFFEIDTDCTFDALYLQPLVFAVRSGKAYPMQLMIDVKTSAEATLQEITRQLSRYPDVFNAHSLVKIVLSGNRPHPQKWNFYPPIIQFDGRLDETYTPQQWQRVGLVSENFSNYKMVWWRKAVLCPNTCEKLKKIVDFVHSKGKKMRFWLTPDSPNAWKTLSDLGVDFINTDTPKALNAFFQAKMKETILVQNR
jgi:alkaline phosphatase